jgi:hypothetical protein
MNSADPRGKSSRYLQKTSLRFKKEKFEFVHTQFIIDEHYVGEPPRVQVGFMNLNDNIDEKFLRKEISKVGHIRTLEIVRHPQTRRHLGLAKVQFEDPTSATKCVELYDCHTLMGKQLSVFLDVRFARIEEEKMRLMNPEPKARNNIAQPPKPLNPLPPIHPLTQLPYPPIQIPSPMQQDMAKSINRSSHTSLSLDDRLAKLGLKQTGVYPPIPQQVYPIQERNTTLQQYHQNHMISRQERKVEVHALPNQNSYEEDEKAWNPDSKPMKEEIKEAIKEEIKEEINLTDEQIVEEVMPYCEDRFLKDLRRNLLTTLQRRLIQTFGYPHINQAQERHKMERDRQALEKLREEQENKNKERERLAMMQASNRVKERKYVGREVAESSVRQKVGVVRMRRENVIQNNVQGKKPASGMFSRINRSAALYESKEQEDRQRSVGSLSDSSSRHSRSPDRFTSSSSDTSRSSSPDSSVSSSSLSSDVSSRRSSHSSYSSIHSLKTEKTHRFKNENLDIAEQLKPTEAIEKVAAEALLEFSSQNHSVERSVPKVETKKRKKKITEQEKQLNKKFKADEKKEEKKDSTKLEAPKPVIFPPRSAEMVARMYSSLDIDAEDKEYLHKYHDNYKQERRTPDEGVGVVFSSDAADLHLKILKDDETMAELAKGCHPKWWNGCSRCSMIEISDKGKIDETTVDEDLQKAAIKSHVIQAANSTRRDQRNDQRRIAALNPEIDPSFLKQLTSNTLQMRAKNLRFSRSKIHKWGLFACEKIANGDAVIEYVGEKIRPSVADHREKIVYTNLPTHDGSSYFFRVDSDVIDATLKGNKARFINHSCNPNCIAKVIKHENGTNSIVIYAKQTINEDEEITYDYKFPREETGEKILCRCKAINCQKYLN